MTYKVVITNVFGPLNRGDHELFEVLVENLDLYDVNISAIARDPELCSKYFSNIEFHEQLGKFNSSSSIRNMAIRLLYLAACSISPFIQVSTFFLPISQREAIQAIREADFVIGSPGGFLEDSTLSLYAHMTQLLVAILYRKKLVLAPMSIGPIKNSLSKRILKFILYRTDWIFVRELASENFCSEIGVNCQLSNDLALLKLPLLIQESQEIKQSKPGKYLAATVINWSFPESRNSSEARKTYVIKIAKTLNLLHDQTQLPVKLIVQVESDLDVIKQVKENLDAPTEILYSANTPEKIKELLDNSYCLIASRFHSAIFALSVGCPVVALAYLPKTSGMLDMYGLPELYKPIHDFDPVELADTLYNLGSDKGKFAQKLFDLSKAINNIGNPFFYLLSENLAKKDC